MFGQRSVYNANRPEVHDVIRRWRQLADCYDPPRVLVGETPADEPSSWWSSMATTTSCISRSTSGSSRRRSRPTPLRDIVEATEALLPADAWPVWTGATTTCPGFPTRWAGDDPRKIRTALVMLFGLRGTPVLYQGDEIGHGRHAGDATRSAAIRSA